MILLNEVKLSPVDLNKPFYPNHEYSDKFEKRGELLLYKINNQEPITTIIGDEIIIDKDLSKEAINYLEKEDYSKLGMGKKLFFDKENNKYSLSNFFKTKEFGSSSGSGGGVVQTAIQESAQCIINAVSFNILGKEITFEDINQDILLETKTYIDISEDLDKTIEFILSNKIWLESLILTSNLLYKNYNSNSYEHHRGSTFVDNIYKNYSIAKKAKKLNINNDKWNPADIWLVDLSTTFTFPKELDKLNSYLLELFNNKKLIGVSLKKVKGTANLNIFNNNQESSNKNNFKYEGYKSSKFANNSFILFNDGAISFRTFNFATNFAGEIKGKNAAQGKIGHGIINNFLIKENFLELPTTKEVLDNIDKYKLEFEKLWLKYTDGETKEELEEIINEKNENFIISKYLSLRIIDLFENNKTKINNLLNNILTYASSSTPFSSVFIKIK